MKISTMRTVDRLVGAPVCFILTRWRKLMVLLGLRRKQPDKPTSILIVKLAEQGATVLAYPAIRRACELVGRENVYFMVFKENRFILDVMDLIPPENVIIIDTRSTAMMVLGTLAALRRVRRLGVDAVIDMEFFARSSAILSYLSGAGIRVGYHRFNEEAGYRGDLHTHRLSYNPHIHVTTAFFTMVEAVWADPDRLPAMEMDVPENLDEPPIFQLPQQELAAVRAVLEAETGLQQPSPLILLNANCSDMLPLRRWPTNRYIELAEHVLKTYSRAVVAFTGSPAEMQGAAELAAKINSPRCVSLAGKTSLRQLLGLYSLADVMVTNDSGPAHFASLTPMHVITIFGPETPALFGGRGKRHHILWSAPPCSPCVSAYNARLSMCRNNICMRRISVPDVAGQIDSILVRPD